MGRDVIVTNFAGCMSNLVEAGMNTDPIMVYDLTEYISMSPMPSGFSIMCNDSKMINSVNQAYYTAITE